MSVSSSSNSPMGTPCASLLPSPETSPVLTRKKAGTSCETLAEQMKRAKNQRIDSLKEEIKDAVAPILVDACADAIRVGIPLACSSKHKAIKIPACLAPFISSAAGASATACEKSAEILVPPIIDCACDASAWSLKKTTDKVVDFCYKNIKN